MKQPKHYMIVATKKGQVIKVDPDTIRCTRRGTMGVKLMGLNEGDEVVSVALRREED